MTDTIIHADAAPKPVGRVSARRAARAVPFRPASSAHAGGDAIPGNVYDDNGLLVEYDIEAQCRSVFANVRIVLEASGARWEDLVDVTVYLTDMERDFGAYNRVYAEHFGEAKPCRTTVGITELRRDRDRLKCIAWLGDR